MAKKTTKSGPQPPAWLRKECRKRWKELWDEFGGDNIKPSESQAIARLAHASVDLEAAEAAVKKSGNIVTGENGISYIHPAVKLRNALATEYRMLLKTLEKRPKTDAKRTAEEVLSSLRKMMFGKGDGKKTAADVLREARIRTATLAAEDCQREQQNATA